VPLYDTKSSFTRNLRYNVVGNLTMIYQLYRLHSFEQIRELRIQWKKKVVFTYLKELSRHVAEENGEKQKTSRNMASLPTEVPNRNLPNMKQKQRWYRNIWPMRYTRIQWSMNQHVTVCHQLHGSYGIWDGKMVLLRVKIGNRR